MSKFNDTITQKNINSAPHDPNALDRRFSHINLNFKILPADLQYQKYYDVGIAERVMCIKLCWFMINWNVGAAPPKLMLLQIGVRNERNINYSMSNYGLGLALPLQLDSAQDGYYSGYTNFPENIEVFRFKNNDGIVKSMCVLSLTDAYGKTYTNFTDAYFGLQLTAENWMI
jgi:hypothetical protein